MFELFIITIIFVGVALLGLSIRMLIKRGGKFPETHISQNKEMKLRGISCYLSQEKSERIPAPHQSSTGEAEFNCHCKDNSCYIDFEK